MKNPIEHYRRMDGYHASHRQITEDVWKSRQKIKVFVCSVVFSPIIHLYLWGSRDYELHLFQEQCVNMEYIQGPKHKKKICQNKNLVHEVPCLLSCVALLRVFLCLVSLHTFIWVLHDFRVSYTCAISSYLKTYGKNSVFIN